jgi:hypothetical protein
MIEKAREARKALVALAGALTALLAANILPDDVAGYVAGVLAFLAVFGVYAAPNTPNAALAGVDLLVDTDKPAGDQPISQSPNEVIE